MAVGVTAAFAGAAGAGLGAFAAFAKPPPRPARPVLTTVPARTDSSSDATFAWRAPTGRRWKTGTTFLCSLDGHAWAGCRTPKTYRGLDPRDHVFGVRATLRGRTGRANGFSWTIEAAAGPGAPAITVHPPETTTSTEASFAFGADGAAGFECRLDGAAWLPCTSPITYVGLTAGGHEFCVRPLSSGGTPGPVACTAWVQEQLADAPAPPPSAPPAVPDLFTITGDLSTLLSPGAAGPLPLTITNPNGYDVLVTDLVVSVRSGSSRAGCDGPSNLEITQSNIASGGASVLVPANGSVTLPAQGATAPTIAMLDLPTNQDACKGAIFALAFSGSGTPG